MLAAAPVAHARSKEPVLPPNIRNGDGNEYGAALPLPRNYPHQRSRLTGPEGMQLGAHFGGQVMARLPAEPPHDEHILAGINQVPPFSERPTQ